MAAIHSKRSGSIISTIFEMFSLHPLPLSVLPLVTVAVLLLLAPSLFSLLKFSVKPSKGNTHSVLLAITITLIILVRWLSSSKDKVSLSSPHSKGCFPSINGCFSEGFLPFIVAALIMMLVVMGRYQNETHRKWLLGFG